MVAEGLSRRGQEPARDAPALKMGATQTPKPPLNMGAKQHRTPKPPLNMGATQHRTPKPPLNMGATLT